VKATYDAKTDTLSIILKAEFLRQMPTSPRATRTSQV
jgi:hypothetical protein